MVLICESIPARKIWLTISQVEGTTSPLCALFEKHEYELMNSQKSHKLPYCVGALPAANHVSGCFSAVKAGHMLYQQKADMILEKELATATTGVRLLRFCV